MAAEEDEIDVLGDFSFDSCLAQNTQGIPSCSDREDTVHPQWLLDGTAANWYDNEKNKSRQKSSTATSVVLSGNRQKYKTKLEDVPTVWSSEERDILDKEMKKYGRDAKKISEVLKSKTEAEILALIEVEHGIQLDSHPFELEKTEIDYDEVPLVLQEEIVNDDSQISEVMSMVTTGTPTVPDIKPLHKTKSQSRKSLLKPNTLNKQPNDLIAINPSEIFYEDEINIGSTEFVGSEIILESSVPKRPPRSKNVESKLKPKLSKKIGNHRRKVSRNYEKSSPKLKNKMVELKSPRRQRKDSGLSEESTRSPKMQIVLGSGQSLPVSEGEQVIKIEKKKDSEPESDIEVDIDSDTSDNKIMEPKKPVKQNLDHAEEPIAVPLAKFEPMPRRQKKINLDGDGGYTIMHTEAGDLFSVGSEPKRERATKKQQISLLHCRVYNADNPAPYELVINVSALIAMDVQAHASRSEVMGLAGGELRGRVLAVRAYRAAAAAATSTHCDMDPVSQAQAAESLRGLGLTLVGWHHSHPAFPAWPSGVDVRSQAQLQAALERPAAPFVAIVTSQHWSVGRNASHYKCFRVEQTAEGEVGFSLRARLAADVTRGTLARLERELRAAVRVEALSAQPVRAHDTCPIAQLTYLDKCISSVKHHLRSAGYSEDDYVTKQIVKMLHDIFR